MPHSCARGFRGDIPFRFRVLVWWSVTLSLTACAPAMRRQIVNPPGISPLLPAYSVVIRHGDMVFVSGMTAVRMSDSFVIPSGTTAICYSVLLFAGNAVPITTYYPGCLDLTRSK